MSGLGWLAIAPPSIGQMLGKTTAGHAPRGDHRGRLSESGIPSRSINRMEVWLSGASRGMPRAAGQVCGSERRVRV